MEQLPTMWTEPDRSQRAAHPQVTTCVASLRRSPSSQEATMSTPAHAWAFSRVASVTKGRGVCPRIQTSPRRHRVQQLARALSDEILHDAICMNVEAVLLHAGENHAADIVGRRARL